MSTSPEHEELRDLLPGAALGALDEPDLERVRKHVAECQACRRVLEEYRTTTARLGLLLPQREMDPAREASVRSRLSARSRADARSAAAVPESPTPGSRAGALLTGRWMGWMVAAGLAGVLLLHHAVHRPVDYGWLIAGGLAIVLAAVGVYACGQRARVQRLERLLPDGSSIPTRAAAGSTPPENRNWQEP